MDELEGKDLIPGYGFFRRSIRRARERKRLYDVRMNFRIHEIESMEDFYRVSEEVQRRIYMDTANPVGNTAFLFYHVVATDMTLRALNYVSTILAELLRGTISG